MSNEFSTLGEATEVLSGFAWKSSQFSSDNSGIPIVRIQNVAEENEREDFVYWTNEYNPKFIVSDGDILLSLSGNIKLGIWDGGDALLNQRIIRVTPKPKIDKSYLYYFLLQAVNHIASLGKKAVISNVSINDVKDMIIPLPPLPIQKQIAALLEKADTLRSQCKQMEQELNQLAQSVFLEIFGDPVTNPKSSKMVSLGNIAEVQIGPFGSLLHKSDYIDNGVPLINPTHIVSGSIKPSSELSITKRKYDELPQYHLKENDIIMARRGEMGRCAVVTIQSEGWFCGTGSLYVRPDTVHTTPLYLQKVLSSLSIKRYLEEQSLGATMPNLNKSIVSGIPIPLPPLVEQYRFETILRQIEARQLEQQNLLLEYENNFNSLIQRSFNGKLNLTKAA